MCSHFHIKDAGDAPITRRYFYLLCCSALIGSLRRASISRDPFYDMLATRKRRIASKKWRQSALPSAAPLHPRLHQEHLGRGGRDAPLGERPSPRSLPHHQHHHHLMVMTSVPLESTSGLFGAHMHACRAWSTRPCVCGCLCVHANVASAAWVRAELTCASVLDVRRMAGRGPSDAASPGATSEDTPCFKPQDGTWTVLSQLGWFHTFVCSGESWKKKSDLVISNILFQFFKFFFLNQPIFWQ